MLIEFRESVRMKAPLEAVWDFILDPDKIVSCMPGAELKERHPDRSFDGMLHVSFGGMTVQFTGHVAYQNIDEIAHSVDMAVTAKQYGGGGLSGVINTRISAPSSGETDIEVVSSADLKGGLVRAGQSMIEAMASEIIKEYIANVQRSLDRMANDSAHPAMPSDRARPLSAWRLLLSVLRRKLGSWFGKLRPE
jgi:carbon monoxide dehydrogenase subunit G